MDHCDDGRFSKSFLILLFPWSFAFHPIGCVSSFVSNNGWVWFGVEFCLLRFTVVSVGKVSNSARNHWLACRFLKTKTKKTIVIDGELNKKKTFMQGKEKKSNILLQYLIN